MRNASRHGADLEGALKAANKPPPERADIAAYIASVLPQLASMAEHAELDLTAYLLDMARLELEEQVERSIPRGG